MIKKKAVFLAKRHDNAINTVFSPDILKSLESLTDLYDRIVDMDDLAENAGLLTDVEVVFSSWGMPEFSEDDIRKYMPNLKAVFYAAGSVQNFARPFLNNNIIVVSAWAANAVPVAEYAVSQILLANKGFFQSTVKYRKDYTAARKFAETFPGNYSIKTGILGAGMIGSMVIEMLKQHNMEILVFDPFLSDERAKDMGVNKCSLVEIFSCCQTISNHMADNAQTSGILNKEHFSLMLENTTFINTGRGAQVVEKDLIEALREEPGRTAVLDVTCPEPVESDSELLKLDNVFLTPHIAGSMNHELYRMSQLVLQEFIRYEKGEALKHSVTLEMLKTMA
ncbi:MAG: hydroxyacid dehydrogenase [Ruminiclostridium sp.]|nr:hydroxyacid dehydrogenase [Ruminiclostridium sp.]